MLRLERAALEAAALAHSLASDGFRSVALSFTDDVYGRTAETVFSHVWAGLLGRSVTDSIAMPANMGDYSGQIATLAAAGGDCIVVLGELGVVGQQSFLNGLKDSGGFFDLAVTSPWYDAAFAQSAGLGLDVHGISITGSAVTVLETPKDKPVFSSLPVGALAFPGLQIGEGNAADIFAGTNGPDVMFGRAGNDTLLGAGWQDHLEGGAGQDYLAGGVGDDQLFGGGGNDTIGGGVGRDTLQGEAGDDRLSGGMGADRFVFASGDGRDVLRDFDRSTGDRLYLDDALWGGGLTRAAIVQTYGKVTPAGAVLNFGDGDLVILAGINSLDTLAGSLVIF